MTDIPKDFEEWCTDENLGVPVRLNGSHVEAARRGFQAGRAHDVDGLIAALRESCFRLDNEPVLRMDSASKIIRKRLGKE